MSGSTQQESNEREGSIVVPSGIPFEAPQSLDNDEIESAETPDPGLIEEAKDIASVVDHPGWKAVNKIFKKHIEASATAGLTGKQANELSDEALGRRMRTAREVASRLDQILAEIEAAVKVVNTLSEREAANAKAQQATAKKRGS